MSEHQGSGDAPNVRGDLAVFFGPRGKGYLAYYDERQQRPGAPPLSWSWPAFGGWIAWTCYRKLWLYGLAGLFLPLIADYFFPFVGGLIAYVLIALFAKEACLRGGFQAVRAADRLGLEDAARFDYLRRTGGVSPVAGMTAAIVVLALGFVWTYLMVGRLLTEMDAMGLLSPGI